MRGLKVEERYRISFGDTLVIVAAYGAKCERILTEDLNSGQVIEGVIIENPLTVRNS